MSLYFTPDRAFPNEINHCGNTKTICSLPSSKTALSYCCEKRTTAGFSEMTFLVAKIVFWREEIEIDVTIIVTH